MKIGQKTVDKRKYPEPFIAQIKTSANLTILDNYSKLSLNNI